MKHRRSRPPSQGRRRVRTWLAVLSLVLGAALLATFPDSGPVVAQEPEKTAEEETGTADGEPAAAEPAGAPPVPRVVLIRIASAIHPVSSEFLVDSLAEADEMGAELFLVELSTPGGLLTSTREITQAMLSARTPVAVYVAPSGAQAASAGFFILMAADVAAMAPGTNTGAAHPVGGQGEDIEGDMGKKVEEDAAATIRSLAEQHGRDVELAQSAVLESKSFSADEALEKGLIDLIAPRVEDLLDQVDGREIKKSGRDPVILDTADAEIVELEMPVLRRFLASIVRPEIATLLMALGMLGIYMELSNPGTILPGFVGAVCLILGLYAMSILPINYAGIALLLLALVLFIAETQVPTFGLLTLGGAVSLILGVVMLYKDVEPPMRAASGFLVALVVAVLAIVLPLTYRSLQVRNLQVTTGKEGLIGERGVARTALGPRGKVFVHGEVWTAVADGPLPAGSPIEVTAVDGLVLHVQPSDAGVSSAGAASRS